jgi:hypothetical protein
MHRLIPAIRNACSPRFPVVQRRRSPLTLSLTLHRASVIVISFTAKPSPPHEDVHALPLSIDRRNQQRPAARRHHYNLQSTAL